MKTLLNTKVKDMKAITLIALVITIIVLLILSGIAVAQLSNNGLFERTKLAKEKWDNAESNQDEIISDYSNTVEEIIEGRGTNKSTFKIEKIGQVTGNTAIVFDPSKYDALYVKIKEGKYNQFLSNTFYTLDLTNGVYWVGTGPCNAAGRWAYVVISDMSKMVLTDVYSDGNNCLSTSVLYLYGINY